jgi:hypothetical protein
MAVGAVSSLVDRRWSSIVGRSCLHFIHFAGTSVPSPSVPSDFSESMTTPTSPTPSADRPTQRREFLGQIAASAIVLAGAACVTPAVAGPGSTTAPAPNAGGVPPTTAPTAPAPPVHWDDSWFGRLTAKHKAVFDSPQFDDGLALSNASGYIRGMRDAAGAGENDVQAVVVMRHAAIPMVLNDAMWAKYEIGKERKIKDFSNDKWAVRNPVLSSPPSSNPNARPATGNRPQANLTWLAANGHVLLGCDLALRGYAGQVASRTKTEMRVVYEELKANLVAGVILQPTGVYAAHRAQEAGCSYIRST